jgi:hypothetical protein
MAFEQRDNSGSLFKNERKDKDSHPDYTGNGMIDGKGFWFSAWIKKDRNGKSFMSMSFKPKEDQPPQRQAPRQQARQPDRAPKQEQWNDFNDQGRRGEMNDEIPF